MINTDNPTPSLPQYYNEEMSLIDVWNILMQHKKLLIGTFLIVVLAAGVYLVLAKRVYESQAVIQVGQVGQVGQYGQLVLAGQSRQVEDIEVIERRLTVEYPELKSIESTKNIITLVTDSYDREQSRKTLQKVVDALLNMHGDLYQDMLSPLQERQDLNERRLADYQLQLTKLDHQINQLREDNSTQAAILMIEQGNIISAMHQIEDKLSELKYTTSEPQSAPTLLLGELKTPEQPIKPRPLLVMALSIILGFMIGIIVAFLAEMIYKARSRHTV